jgi:hypothetical protein
LTQKYYILKSLIKLLFIKKEGGVFMQKGLELSVFGYLCGLSKYTVKDSKKVKYRADLLVTKETNSGFYSNIINFIITEEQYEQLRVKGLLKEIGIRFVISQYKGKDYYLAQEVAE